MNNKALNNILPLVEFPSRYLGSEINSIKKDYADIKLSMALAFPDLYEIGTSHFGLQILYNILNNHSEIAAERVFAPFDDMEAYLRSNNIHLMSLESHKPLIDFDIIGFSLLYEMNYTNILTMLDLSGIPFYARQRDLSFPFIIAGGVCTCNPEPVADFFDAIVVGDGEKVIMEMSLAWICWKDNGGNDKETMLKAWSEIEGVYIPSFFNAEFDQYGFQTCLPDHLKLNSHKKIKRAILPDLDNAPFPEVPVIPYGRPVHDRLRIEIARGCTRGCRFCQAGMVYRPVRERSPGNLLALSDASVAATGYDDISLLSLSTGDYGCIVPLMERLMNKCEAEKIAVSFPSLRAGTLTPELMNLVKRVRKTGFTIAAEAGSQRLRDVINKNITKKEIMESVTNAFALGWKTIKIYFMIGLPTETDDDLKAIVDLVRELRFLISGKHGQGKKPKINVSVSTFIPKPHTPFQWARQISLASSKEKIRMLQDNLKMPGIQFKWQNPELSLLEGLWSRGDRRLSGLLVAAYNKGCRFDGWSDKFQYRLWEEAISETGIDIDFYTARPRDPGEPLPWDHIDTRVAKLFLKMEWEKAVSGQHTGDCRVGVCNDCGVCDFKRIEPVVYRPDEVNLQDIKKKGIHTLYDQEKISYKKLRISYSKKKQAKFFGHLELANIFIRAVKRGCIPVKFSEGFHPKPKFSFEDPLPIGMESENESLYITVPINIKPEDIVQKLNKHLPEGLLVINCSIAPLKKSVKTFRPVVYSVVLQTGSFDEEKLKSFINTPELIITKLNKKKKIKRIDLKNIITKIVLLSPDRLLVTIRTDPGNTIRPSEALINIFGLKEKEIKQATIIKTSFDQPPYSGMHNKI